MTHIILETIGDFWMIIAASVAISTIIATIGQWRTTCK